MGFKKGAWRGVEGVDIQSTGEAGGTKVLTEDGDGTSSWTAPAVQTVEGTAILSTGEAVTKFLRSDGDNSSSWQVPAGGGNHYAVFTANDATLPASNPAGIGSRNAHPMLAFDDTTSESCYLHGVMSEDYDNSSNIVVEVAWMSEDQTSGAAQIEVAWERHQADTTDLDSDSFAAVQVSSDTTASATGELIYAAITFTTAQADGIQSGESFRLQLSRNPAGTDTLTNDAQVVTVQVRAA